LSNTVIGDALRTWVGHDNYLGAVSNAWDDLLSLEGPDLNLINVFSYQAQTVIAYTLAQRARMISQWMSEGGEDGRTNEQIEGLVPSVEDMAILNEVVAANGLDQVFRYLYVHAHLVKYLYDTGPWAALSAIRDDIRPL